VGSRSEDRIARAARRPSGQPVYAIDEPPEPGDTGLRAGDAGDFDVLLPACAAAHEEEIGIDPLQRDPTASAGGRAARSTSGRSWVWLDGATILFKAEASAWTPSAVQIQQVWVDPSVRGRGYAQRGMRDLCRCCSAECRASACSCVPRTRRRSACTRRSACSRARVSQRHLLMGIERIVLGGGNFGGVGSDLSLVGKGETEQEAFVGSWTRHGRAAFAGSTLLVVRRRAQRADARRVDRGAAPRGARLTSKAFHPVHEGDDSGLAPARIRRVVRESAERLGVDRIDLYLVHEPDPRRTPLAATLSAL
jgi:hypothetical protein